MSRRLAAGGCEECLRCLCLLIAHLKESPFGVLRTWSNRLGIRKIFACFLLFRKLCSGAFFLLIVPLLFGIGFEL